MIKINGKEVEFTKFPNGETLVHTELLNQLKTDKRVRIDFKYFSDDDILHLYFVLKHLFYLNVNRKDLYIYYMPYSRMDRNQNGNCFTLSHIIDLIKCTLLDNDMIYIIEPHSDASIQYFMSAFRVNVITPLMQKILTKHPEINMICYPDKGAKERFCDDDVNLPAVYCNKVRDFDTGEIKGLELDGDIDIQGKNILILDDLCSKGGTFYHTANKLKEAGANNVYLGVCHIEGTVLDGKLLNEASPIEHIYCMNTMLDFIIHKKITIYDIEQFLNKNVMEEI